MTLEKTVEEGQGKRTAVDGPVVISLVCLTWISGREGAPGRQEGQEDWELPEGAELCLACPVPTKLAGRPPEQTSD